MYLTHISLVSIVLVELAPRLCPCLLAIAICYASTCCVMYSVPRYTMRGNETFLAESEGWCPAGAHQPVRASLSSSLLLRIQNCSLSLVTAHKLLSTLHKSTSYQIASWATSRTLFPKNVIRFGAGGMGSLRIACSERQWNWGRRRRRPTMIRPRRGRQQLFITRHSKK